ncbi:MAG: hypothetical protein GWO02_13135, partial [Gammaproteobacteria bacterium]|nr:hypothetical protein [Gammaproteobacteria bacterium]
GALEGEPLDVLIPERFRELHRRHVREFLTDPAPSRMMGERGEIVGVRRDGGEVP